VERNWLLDQLAAARAQFDKWPKWYQDQMLFAAEVSSGKIKRDDGMTALEVKGVTRCLY
jgi:hypothetical protein